jgi:hypothetical protein
MVELLVLTNLDLLLFKIEKLFTFFTTQATLMRRSTVLRLPSQLVFLASTKSFKANLEFLFQRSILH